MLSVRELNLPSGVTVLDQPGGNLFKEVTIPENVQSISNFIFSGCPLLEEINIGRNTKITLSESIYHDAGYLYNTDVKAVNVHADNPYLYNIDGVLFTKADNVLR